MPRFRILTATLVVLTLLLRALAAPAAGAGGKRSYIVVLKQGGVAPAAAAKEARENGASVKHVYKHTIKGYAAKLSDADVEALRDRSERRSTSSATASSASRRPTRVAVPGRRAEAGPRTRPQAGGSIGSTSATCRCRAPTRTSATGAG